MPKLFVEPEQIAGDFCRIEGADVPHIRGALRMAVGDAIDLSAGDGDLCRGRIEQIEKDVITVRILEKIPGMAELPVRITLYQGLPKKDKLEWITQKAVELGASEIVPVLMDRSVAKPGDEKKENRKNERLSLIAREAAVQSGRDLIPAVLPVMSFKEAVLRAESEPDALCLIPYEDCDAETMQETRDLLFSGTARQISIFIGPEGGIAPEELEYAKEHGIRPISLGGRILRTETAAIAVLSVLSIAYDHLPDRK